MDDEKDITDDEIPGIKKNSRVPAELQKGHIDNVDEYLPAVMVDLVTASKTKEEWESKVRWLVALLFFRVRAYEYKTRLRILKIVQPTERTVLNSSSAESIGFLGELVIILQARIIEAHDLLARTFLDHTVCGRDFLLKRKEQR